MKRITLTLTMALGCLMTTQSFGFDLLDRMMGSKGCGCDTACCEAPVDPHCGAETVACCPAEPVCGCEAPACGCEAPACDSCCTPKRAGLLNRLFSGCKKSSCCDDPCAEPACGCEPVCGCPEVPACGCEAPACDSCCTPKRGGLLSKLFSGRKKSNCCDMGCDSCGCASPGYVPASQPSMNSAPEAPAPIVDPNASIQSKRRVVQASARYVR